MHDLDDAPSAQAPPHETPTDGAGPAPSGRRRWPSVGAGALAVLFVAGAIAVAQRPTPTEVRVDRVGDDWVFRWDEAGPDPSEIERMAGEVGLDVTAEATTTGPSNVGRILGHSSTPPAIDIRIDDDLARGDLGFRVPADQDGPLTLRLGSPAGARELWESSAPATAPGEVLSCRSLLSAPLDRTLDALEGTGVSIDGLVDVDSGNVLRTPTPDQLRAEGGRPVRSLSSTSDHTMLVEVGDPSGGTGRIQYPQGC